jgi:hypothetical protein
MAAELNTLRRVGFFFSPYEQEKEPKTLREGSRLAKISIMEGIHEELKLANHVIELYCTIFCGLPENFPAIQMRESHCSHQFTPSGRRLHKPRAYLLNIT